MFGDGEIPENASNIEISKSGEVYMTVDGEQQLVGNIQLFKFVNPSGLLGYGDNMWVPGEASGEAIAGIPGEEGYGFNDC